MAAVPSAGVCYSITWNSSWNRGCRRHDRGRDGRCQGRRRDHAGSGARAPQAGAQAILPAFAVERASPRAVPDCLRMLRLDGAFHSAKTSPRQSRSFHVSGK